MDDNNEIKIELQNLRIHLKTLNFYERSQFLIKEFDVFENSFVFQDELVVCVMEVLIEKYEKFSEYKIILEQLEFDDFILNYDYEKMFDLLKENGLILKDHYYITTYMNSGDSFFNENEIDNKRLFDSIYNEYVKECRNIKLNDILK